MACTPKVVRRNGGCCVCPDSGDKIRAHDYDDGSCNRGYCYSAKCRACRGELFGTGPVACPCENVREARYPGMRQLGRWDLEKDEWIRTHAAVKLSKRRNQ